MKKLLTTIALLSLLSCTGNQRAKTFGGTETVELKPNEKFINITWKETSLWVITQDTLTGIFYAREKSSYGIIEVRLLSNNLFNLCRNELYTRYM